MAAAASAHFSDPPSLTISAPLQSNQTTAPSTYLRRAHSFMTIPAATASGSEWFTP